MLRADKKTDSIDENRSIYLVFSKYGEAQRISIFGMKCAILHLYGERLSSVSFISVGEYHQKQYLIHRILEITESPERLDNSCDM